MKEVLYFLDKIEIHAPDFDCDIDGDSDGPAATDQDVNLKRQLTTKSLNIICPIHSPTDIHNNLGISSPFHFGLH